MGVILFGYIDFEGQDIVPLLQGAREMIEVVYDEPGCIHYVWTADVLREGRLWVYEEWESSETLAGHLAAEPYFQMANYLKEKGITGASVDKYRFDLKEPIYDATGVPQAGFSGA